MMVVKEMVMGRNTFFEAKLAEKGSPAPSPSRKERTIRGVTFLSNGVGGERMNKVKDRVLARSPDH